MKRLSFLMLAATVAASSLFVSCNSNDSSAANIAFDNVTNDLVQLTQGQTDYVVNATISSSDNMKSVTVSQEIGSLTNEVTKITSFSDKNNYHLSQTISNITTDCRIIVSVDNGVTTSRALTIKVYTDGGDVTPPVGSPLTTASFTWERSGTSAGTGVSDYGLSWTSNTASNATITAASGTKLVNLTTANWTGITTKEDLAAAIDGAASISQYTNVSVTSNQLYTDVLGVKTAGGVYYMINVTKSTVTSDAIKGTTITVTGQTKS